MLNQLKDDGMQPVGEFTSAQGVQTLAELDASAWRKAMGEAKFRHFPQSALR